jgi:hypothetical protein
MERLSTIDLDVLADFIVRAIAHTYAGSGGAVAPSRPARTTCSRRMALSPTSTPASKMKVSGHATASRRREAEPGLGVAVRSTDGGSGGRFEGDAVTKGLEFANVVALFKFWIHMGVVEAGAEVVELGAVVAKQVPEDDQDWNGLPRRQPSSCHDGGRCADSARLGTCWSCSSRPQPRPGPEPSSGRRYPWTRCPSCGQRTP